MKNFQAQFDLVKEAIEQANESALSTLLVEATGRRKDLEASDLKLQFKQDSE